MTRATKLSLSLSFVCLSFSLRPRHHFAFRFLCLFLRTGLISLIAMSLSFILYCKEDSLIPSRVVVRTCTC